MLRLHKLKMLSLSKLARKKPRKTKLLSFYKYNPKFNLLYNLKVRYLINLKANLLTTQTLLQQQANQATPTQFLLPSHLQQKKRKTRLRVCCLPLPSQKSKNHNN